MKDSKLMLSVEPKRQKVFTTKNGEAPLTSRCWLDLGSRYY